MLLLTPTPVWIQAAPNSPYWKKTAPRFLSLPDAVAQVMEDFDADEPSKLRSPLVAPADQPYLRWLRSAATDDIPVNPFARGTAAFREGEEALAFFRKGYGQDPALLARLKTRQPGTALALWRWGKRGELKQAFTPAFRRAWEDKLMEPSPAAMVRGYALRHSLCFALAEGDEVRFLALKVQWSTEAETLLNSFQRLFGLLGGASPEFRFWELPGLQYKDLRMADLMSFDGSAARRIWICPLLGELPQLPPGTAWLVPTLSGQQNSVETTLLESERNAGEELATRVESAGGRAYFAPSRMDLESLGLAFFPILIELEFNGTIKAIQMGDAAPKKP